MNMETLTQESCGGLYIAVGYSTSSRMKISSDILSKIPNPVAPSDLHTTLIYSNTFDEVSLNQHGYISRIKGYDVWESEYYDSNILVAILDSPSLSARHEFLMRNYDLTYGFDSYIPHITLSKNINRGYNYSHLPDSMILFTSPEYAEDLNK